MFSLSFSSVVTTSYTLFIGVIGAALAYWLSFPLYILTGPAILLSAMSLMGARFAVANVVRDAAFLFIGIGIGAGISSEAMVAVLRWPLAFLALAIMLLTILLISRFLLVRFFGFDPRSAILAASPGHLSYVLSIGSELNLNIANIAVVQSVRLLALTLLVPFVTIAFGVEVTKNILPVGMPMAVAHVAALFVVSLGIGAVFKRFNVPAGLIIGALLVAASAQVAGLTPGTLSPKIALPSFLVLGSMIGARFSGINISQMRNSLLAGLATTGIAVTLAVVAALIIAAVLQMPSAHVIVAFAPGGLDTMIAMGAMLGANPGFVVASHVGRILFLSALVPFILGRARKSPL